MPTQKRVPVMYWLMATIALVGCHIPPSLSNGSSKRVTVSKSNLEENYFVESQQASTYPWQPAFVPHSTLVDRLPAKFASLQFSEAMPEGDSSVRLVSNDGLQSRFAQPIQAHTEPPIAEVPLASQVVNIVAIDGRRVHSIGDCLRLCDFDHPSSPSIQVDFQVRTASNSGPREYGIVVSRRQLLKLLLPESSSHQVVCFQSPSETRYLVRDGDIYAIVYADLKPALGIVRVVLQILNESDQDCLLPLECVVSVGEHPMRCLTADEALQFAYASRKTQESNQPPLNEPKLGFISGSSISAEQAKFFSSVSSRADYMLMPSYSQLALSVDAASQPRFISHEIQYPGPAIRGDAIAVASSLIQKRILSPNESTSGWILFAAHPQLGFHQENNIMAYLTLKDKQLLLPFFFRKNG